MAKPKALEPEVLEPETALATVGIKNQALAVSAGADVNDTRGKEEIDYSKLILPRIAAAQKTSPEIEETSDRFIEGLQKYQMFNSLTGEIYGNGPLVFAIVRKLPFKAMQFSKDLKVIDFDVPQGDPRLEFTKDPVTGERIKPIATEFREYLVLLTDGSVAALSLKSTQIKVADKLDSLLAFRPGASFKGLFKITSKGKEFPGGAATNFTIMPAGATPPEMEAVAAKIYEQTIGKTLTVSADVTPETDDFANADGTEKF